MGHCGTVAGLSPPYTLSLQTLKTLRQVEVINFGDCLVRSKAAVAIAEAVRSGLPKLKVPAVKVTPCTMRGCPGDLMGGRVHLGLCAFCFLPLWFCVCFLSALCLLHLSNQREGVAWVVPV